MNCFGVIYKLTNRVSGRVYIGQTTQPNPWKRINRHFTNQKSKDLVYEAYKKYGQVFDIEILCSCFDLESLNDSETYFIKYFKSIAPSGYNIKFGGGSGGKASEQLKEHFSKIRKGKPTKGRAAKGQPKSLNHRISMSKSRKGFSSENRVKATRLSRRKLSTKILAKNISNGVEICFRSISECASVLDLQAENISRVLNGAQGRTQHKGWVFEKIVKK